MLTHGRVRVFVGSNNNLNLFIVWQGGGARGRAVGGAERGGARPSGAQPSDHCRLETSPAPRECSLAQRRPTELPR